MTPRGGFVILFVAVLLQVCQGLDNRFTLNRVAEVRQSRCSRKNASGYNSIHTRVSTPLAVAIPGNSLPEQVVIGGTANFLQLYNYVITARVLLSWFPQAQGMGFLRPLYTVTDPYLGIFRQLPLQFGGLDLSIIPAFLLLSFLQSNMLALGAKMPKMFQEKQSWIRERVAMIHGRDRGTRTLAGAWRMGANGLE